MWNSPVLTSVTLIPAGRATTKFGVFEVPPPPLPSCPYSLFPQQLMVPLSRSAQVCRKPAVIAVAVRLVPRLMGAPGLSVSVVNPLPS